MDRSAAEETLNLCIDSRRKITVIVTFSSCDGKEKFSAWFATFRASNRKKLSQDRGIFFSALALSTKYRPQVLGQRLSTTLFARALLSWHRRLLLLTQIRPADVIPASVSGGGGGVVGLNCYLKCFWWFSLGGFFLKT